MRSSSETDFWNKHGRWVNRGTTGIALLVDTDKGYKLRHVFDMSDTMWAAVVRNAI